MSAWQFVRGHRAGHRVGRFVGDLFCMYANGIDGHVARHERFVGHDAGSRDAEPRCVVLPALRQASNAER